MCGVVTLICLSFGSNLCGGSSTSCSGGRQDLKLVKLSGVGIIIDSAASLCFGVFCESLICQFWLARFFARGATTAVNGQELKLASLPPPTSFAASPTFLKAD
jgi:hypothetical protein